MGRHPGAGSNYRCTVKILLASSSSGSRGGGELYLLYLGRALAHRGHTVKLWASRHSRMDELSNSFSGIGEVIRSRYRNTYDHRGRSLSSYGNILGARQAASEFRNAGVDFLHVNKQNLEDGLELLRAATASGVMNLCTIHLTQSARFLGARFAPVRDWVARRALLAYPGMLVSVLESRRQDLLDFIGPSPRVRTILNGVPLFDLTQRERVREAKRAELGIAERDLVFLAVGRMVAQKRPLLFLDMAERIHRLLPEARFVWVGDGDLAADWDHAVAHRKLQRMVRRVPWQPDVQPFLLAADAFLHVAEYEGLPLAILEALSAALPCVLTPNLRNEMPFLHDGNSIVIGDGDEWVQTLRDRAQMHLLGSAGRALAERDFSYARMAEQYETLYEFTRRRQP